MIDSSRTPLPVLLALLGILLLALPAVSQDGDPSFGEIVDVRVVNLEIVVTNDKERVVALEAEDFHLLVDGVETPIEYFSEVRHGWAVPAVGDESTMPSLPSDSEVGTRYLIFIDDFFTLPSHRNRVLRAFEQQLPMLAPQDHVALVAFDGRRVEMLTTWTRSLREIERAIDNAMARPSYGLQRRAEQKVFESSFLRDRAGRFGVTRAGYGASSAEDLHRSRELARQVELVVNGASSALRGFARPDGRKVMLFLSGGWPASSEEWLFGSFEATRRYGSLGGARHLFDPLIDTANLLGYTLYPIDVADTVRNAGVNAEYGSLAEASLASNLAIERDFVEESALTMVAAATGGRAFLDGASTSALERSISDTRSYYSIGFAPTWSEDDRRHRVEIKLDNSRFKVRSRTSFSDLSRQTELTMLVESAQLFDHSTRRRGATSGQSRPSLQRRFQQSPGAGRNRNSSRARHRAAELRWLFHQSRVAGRGRRAGR